MLQRRFDNVVARLLDAEIDDAVPVVCQDDVHQILANIVNVSLHGR